MLVHQRVSSDAEKTSVYNALQSSNMVDFPAVKFMVSKYKKNTRGSPSWDWLPGYHLGFYLKKFLFFSTQLFEFYQRDHQKSLQRNHPPNWSTGACAIASRSHWGVKTTAGDPWRTKELWVHDQNSSKLMSVTWWFKFLMISFKIQLF